MNTITVGELIRVLSAFNPEMPVLRSSLHGNGYESIVNSGRFVYSVITYADFVQPPFAQYQAEYIDGDGLPGSFDAIVL